MAGEFRFLMNVAKFNQQLQGELLVIYDVVYEVSNVEFDDLLAMIENGHTFEELDDNESVVAKITEMSAVLKATNAHLYIGLALNRMFDITLPQDKEFDEYIKQFYYEKLQGDWDADILIPLIIELKGAVLDMDLQDVLYPKCFGDSVMQYNKEAMKAAKLGWYNMKPLVYSDVLNQDFVGALKKVKIDVAQPNPPAPAPGPAPVQPEAQSFMAKFMSSVHMPSASGILYFGVAISLIVAMYMLSSEKVKDIGASIFGKD